jgi:vacuolar-type H+-ATPase subunit H
LTGDSSATAKALEAFTEMEKQIDDLAKSVADMKRQLLSKAQEEAENVRVKLLNQMKLNEDKELNEVAEKAEAEAARIIEGKEEELKLIRKKIAAKKKEALALVQKTLED